MLPDQRRCRGRGRGRGRGRDRGHEGDLRVEASAQVSGHLWDHRSNDLWGYASVCRAAERALTEAGRTAAEIDVL